MNQIMFLRLSWYSL